MDGRLTKFYQEEKTFDLAYCKTLFYLIDFPLEEI